MLDQIFSSIFPIKEHSRMKRVEISSTEFTMPIIGSKELAGDSLVEIFHGAARLRSSREKIINLMFLLLIHFFWTSVRIGLKGMASRMVLRRILHLREKSNLISNNSFFFFSALSSFKQSLKKYVFQRIQHWYQALQRAELASWQLEHAVPRQRGCFHACQKLCKKV